ncbi:aminodeoxychorismate synthase, subunit I [Acetitomaculum ruminis DSM 5522]|uniref:Anthranilate synthase component 1 n=1 Tax=Acetitomaculum ruminis DSM 5522 TaxID=1120918 RepID=A0A1I0ZQG5_9FIRM|nr:aminodeoxychorismate synthase component I [Acetitomaculum ruminis]SFB26383.1 aminodeoxychorismate synthase, subunit I [Acetitomaculum ruminis DSM 5522]
MRKIFKLDNYPDMADIFHLLRNKEEAVFLDSSQKSELGKFSIIALRPYLKLVNSRGKFTINGKESKESFLEYVKEYLSEHKEENDSDLPLLSGAVGYFSYDFGRKKEGVESRHNEELEIPDALLYFYDIFVIEDLYKKELFIVANGYTADADKSISLIRDILKNEVESKEFSQDFNSKAYSFFSQKAYMDAVDNMIHYIIDGDIYVVNMTQQLQIESDCNPYDMFRILREKNPSPFGGYMDYGDFQIVCASPERFMNIKDGKVITRPIKGTRKRGKTPKEDLELKNDLQNSKKEQSELLMIVDLERNDLNKVCIPGSVKVTELFKVESYATVFHLVSNVEGRLKEGCNAIDLIKAAFPGGSITGTPKLRAMELIDKEERARRNLYTGSIGYISLNGDCDLNIVIRTAIHKDGVYHLGVGGGITYDSDLAFEFEETWQKARALVDVLKVESKDGEKYEYSVR